MERDKAGLQFGEGPQTTDAWSDRHTKQALDATAAKGWRIREVLGIEVNFCFSA